MGTILTLEEAKKKTREGGKEGKIDDLKTKNMEEE